MRFAIGGESAVLTGRPGGTGEFLGRQEPCSPGSVCAVQRSRHRELAAFRIDPATGKLTHINTVVAGADPAHISVDKGGKFLLTAYYVAGQVTVHTIADDGSLSKQPKQTVKTREKAHAVVLDPRESAVLIPHTRPNVVYALCWYRRSGEIATPSIGSEIFEAPKNSGPRHLVFHPTLEIRGGP